MQKHAPKPGERYRHFKNNLYQIITLAKHSETGEDMVVYQALYGDFEVYVRPLSMFLSEVEHEKYPDAAQTHRFEQVTTSIVDSKESSSNQISPKLMAFLDSDSSEERYRLLSSMEDIIDNHMIDTIAVVSDIVIEDGPVETRYQELKNCLRTKSKFETTRMRF